MTRLVSTLAITTGAALALCLTPELAHACPVCFSGTEANRTAYFVTFVILTTLPLISIGAIVWWVRKRFLEAEATTSTTSVPR